MATLKLVLDQRRKRKDDTFPLLIRITHESKSRDIQLNIHLAKKEWDESTSTVKKCRANAKLLNHKIKSSYVKLEAALLKMEADQEIFSVHQVKTNLTEKPKSTSFFEFGQMWVDRLTTARKVGNARVYRNVLSMFRNYLKGNNITFTDINYEFLQQFETSLLKKGVKVNTISFYLRTIRTIYNKGMKAGYVDRNHYPFEDFSIKNEQTLKRAISREKIMLIDKLELPENTDIWHSRNYFILSFHLIGISFIDLAMIRYKDIQDGRLIYKRKKTGKLYNIKLTARANDIVSHYWNPDFLKNKPDIFLLPIIPVQAWDDEQKEYDFSLHGSRKCNIFLKKIAKLCGIDENLTTYVSRHSWATIAKKMGYSKDLIAEALGHEFGNKVTGIYLDNYEQETIDQANEKVTIK